MNKWMEDPNKVYVVLVGACFIVGFGLIWSVGGWKAALGTVLICSALKAEILDDVKDHYQPKGHEDE